MEHEARPPARFSSLRSFQTGQELHYLKTTENWYRQWGVPQTAFGYRTPGIAGVRLSSVKNPIRTVLVAELSACFSWSWHMPGSTAPFNNAENVVSFVDGYVRYVIVYWNSAFRYPNGASSLALEFDPPAGYDYQWSGD